MCWDRTGWDESPAIGPYIEVVERRRTWASTPSPASWPRGRMRPRAARDALAAREAWQGRRASSQPTPRASTATERTLEQVIRTGEDRRPGMPPHLRGGARLLASEKPGRPGPKGPARSTRPRLGEPRSPHVSLLAPILPQGDRDLRAAWLPASWSGSTRAKTPAGEPRSSSIRRPASIFADLDLAADEAEHDFAHSALPDLPPSQHGGRDRWPARRVDARGGDRIISKPNSTLMRCVRTSKRRRASKSWPPSPTFRSSARPLPRASRWPVAKLRADRCLSLGWISADQHAKFLRDGALGSHLEAFPCKRVKGTKVSTSRPSTPSSPQPTRPPLIATRTFVRPHELPRLPRHRGVRG